jgi:hypothetical protein
MALKECDKCGQMVDEAKAFCPSCDNVFVVEEERREASNFERLDKTVQLGNTMYDMMLSDMGLNISKPAPKPEKRIEVIAPIQTAPAAKKEAAAPPAKPAKSSVTLWIVLGVLGLLILLPFAVFSTIILIRAFMARY